jgi:hypothetical protein
MKEWVLMTVAVAVSCFACRGEAEQQNQYKDGYLFASFRGNGEDGLHLAYSYDGLTWGGLKNDQSFLKPEVGGKLMRDPCVIQGPDGIFHMVWTTSWSDRGIGIAHSKDLIHWSEQQFVPVMMHEPKARNCWAPEITWDPDSRLYIIYWATTIPGQFSETEKSANKGWNHRIYCTSTADFETYTDTRLFYNPGFNVIDSTIVQDADHYVMILKDETRYPPAKNLCLAISDKVTGPWSKASAPFSPEGLWVEGATSIRIGSYWYVYYDAYADQHYGAMRTKDFKTWENMTERLVVPEGMRHGTVFPVFGKMLSGLL